MRIPGLRALAYFWAAVATATLLTIGALLWLGAPEPGTAAAPAAPAAEEAARPPQAAAPIPATAPPATPAPALPIIPAGLPVAPDPPPLGGPLPAAARPPAEITIAAPDPALLEPSRHGPVPRLGPENRSSIRAYARPFDRNDPRPRIGLIVNNIGQRLAFSDDAIRRLPGGVTLGISPYATRIEPLLERARARGMETLIALPLEPQGFGQTTDPGDRALLTSLPLNENRDRLLWALSRIQGQVGAIGGLGGLRGERFAANAELLGTIQADLTQRGLLYVDPRPGAPQPARAYGRAVDLILDEPSSARHEVERRLGELETLARQGHSPIGLANNPDPSVITAIANWAETAESRGLAIAPITALARRPTELTAR
jgi:polysaccharide deacetylase 2 family uncharacterized protein YibQ